MFVGLEYYLPGLDGKVWVSGNYSHMVSNNSSQFARLDRRFSRTRTEFPDRPVAGPPRRGLVDANLFFDPVDAVRVGLEFATFYDHYVDGFTAKDYRGQASGFFLF